jgi:hypothetical protein
MRENNQPKNYILFLVLLSYTWTCMSISPLMSDVRNGICGGSIWDRDVGRYFQGLVSASTNSVTAQDVQLSINQIPGIDRRGLAASVFFAQTGAGLPNIHSIMLRAGIPKSLLSGYEDFERQSDRNSGTIGQLVYSTY